MIPWQESDDKHVVGYLYSYKSLCKNLTDNHVDSDNKHVVDFFSLLKSRGKNLSDNHVGSENKHVVGNISSNSRGKKLADNPWILAANTW